MKPDVPQFTLFGPLHWTMLGAIFVAAAWWVTWARTHPSLVRRRHVEEMLAYANLVLWIVIRLYLVTPEQFRWSIWVPLGMCDIMSLLASIKLLNPHNRWLSIALYFGGVGLCTNALITPDLKEGPRQFEFWAFWLRHAAILVVAIYDLAVLRFRPNWDDWRRACAAGFAYIVLVSAINVPFRANFGFMGDSLPGNPSVLDFLGPWPLRLVWVIVIVGALWAVMMVPWQARRLSGAAVGHFVRRPADAGGR
ncbi:MAG: TIGR02206 family membrane protein [Betaproteobacteria bacterium]